MSIVYKTTNSLFKGIYQYKVVLVVAGSSLFRARDAKEIIEQLKKVNLSVDTTKTPWGYIHSRTSIKTQEDLDYAFKLQAKVAKLKDFEIRIESPFISIYTNNEKDVDALINLDASKVKYISKPPANTSLISGTVVLPKIDYDFRVTLGKTIQEYSAFVQWADSNKKVKLTKSCIRDLNKDHSWGGTYFYITGDNNLLMAKMHLGGAINKVERIIKA